MSELTPCNFCQLQAMKVRARRLPRAGDGVVTVIVQQVYDPTDPMCGWVSARYSDMLKPSAYFMGLTDHCVC